MLDWSEYKRWLSQAMHTLGLVAADMEHGGYGWACFKAQQAAEYALKGFFRLIGEPQFGHSVAKLLSDLPPECQSRVSETLKSCARFLDTLYIPPRYADAFSEGAPWEHYGREEAERALDCAQMIINLVEECAHALQSPGEKEG